MNTFDDFLKELEARVKTYCNQRQVRLEEDYISGYDGKKLYDRVWSSYKGKTGSFTKDGEQYRTVTCSTFRNFECSDYRKPSQYADETEHFIFNETQGVFVKGSITKKGIVKINKGQPKKPVTLENLQWHKLGFGVSGYSKAKRYIVKTESVGQAIEKDNGYSFDDVGGEA